jgi:hypothetical protein
MRSNLGKEGGKVEDCVLSRAGIYAALFVGSSSSWRVAVPPPAESLAVESGEQSTKGTAPGFQRGRSVVTD